ncbi:MAG TPA: hypothetical protein VKY85_25865 [Candidatus Angelobacter sp.]|nr:hypothetical protein [Candidatus Angelobacter sp.]
MATLNRLTDVYKELGRVLNNPAAFGLGPRAPKALVEVLTRARQRLMEEITEQKRWLEEEGDALEVELSQDADSLVELPGKRGLAAKAAR